MSEQPENKKHYTLKPDTEEEGCRLKVRWEVEQEDNMLVFSPSQLNIWLNDIRLNMVKSLQIFIDVNDLPRANLSFYMDKLDIDSDTMLALETYVKQQTESKSTDEDEQDTIG